MATEPTGDAPADVTEPIAYFLDDQRYHGKSERTLEAYERVLRRFETFLADRFDVEAVGNAQRRECMAWIHSLRDEFEDSTIASYASYLNRFYDYMARVGAFADNPMALVMEEMSESIDTNPTRRDISVGEMQSFVGTIAHPLERAVIVTLLKTGMRVGECCNLDLRDLHLELPELDLAWEPRVGLERRPSSVFVSSEPARGTAVNGEERTASNKRKRETVVPVDDELRAALLEWLPSAPTQYRRHGRSSSIPGRRGRAVDTVGCPLYRREARSRVRLVPDRRRHRRERHATLLPALLHHASPGSHR